MNPESAVVGSILLNNKILDEITLVPDDFYDVRLGNLYELMRWLYAEMKPVDVITVGNDLRFAKTKLKAVDLHNLTSEVPSANSGVYYARQVAEASVRRRLILAGQTIVERAKLNENFDLLADASRSDVDSALGIAKSKIVFVGQEIHETFDALTEKSDAIPAPWSLLNKALGGFRKGALYTIGARPGKGKTSVGLGIALEMCKHGMVAFSSLEMSRREIHKRIISNVALIPMDRVMNNNLTDEDWEKTSNARNLLRPQIAIDDRGGVSVNDIRTHARSVAREGNLVGIVVDYLQLITSKDSRPRHEIVAEFSRQLKLLARDFNVPVVMLSQLNRASESRTDKRPSLADLRESGAIEQHSDVVILLHQEDETMIMDVAKNRHGAPATILMGWQGTYAKVIE